MAILNVYAWNRCPHCHAATAWLKERGVPFVYHEIEEQSPEVIAEVIKVNGGDDWVVPTFEYNGLWRPGEIFDPNKLERDLAAWGAI